MNYALGVDGSYSLAHSTKGVLMDDYNSALEALRSYRAAWRLDEANLDHAIALADSLRSISTMAPAALRRSVPWLTHTPLHDDDARDEDVSHAAFEARRHYEAVGSADAEMPAVHRGMAALMDAAREWRARLEHLRLLQALPAPNHNYMEVDAYRLL